MKVMAIISGIGLAILWLVGLGNPGAATWLTWLDAVAALLCFVAAGMVSTRSRAIVGPAAVAVGIFVLWIVGLATNGAPWQNWWTFVFGCTMAIAAAIGSSSMRSRRLGTTAPSATATAEQERFRRSA